MEVRLPWRAFPEFDHRGTMQRFQLLQVTDPHLFADEGRRLYGVQTAESLRRVLAAACAGQRPDAIVATGDIGDDLSAGAYHHFRRMLAAAGAPVYSLPGNHDDPVRMKQLLDADGFQFCGQARLGAWGMVALDTNVPGEAAGQLAASELARLEDELQSLADRPVLVCLHHPPVPVGSPWIDAVGLLNAAEFLAVIDRHPSVRAVLAGHVHQEFDVLRAGVRLLATPSTCAQFTPRTESCVMDRRPPGYRWLTLHPDGRLETRVGWLAELVGEPRDEDEARR
jgi:3',5'-cyclic-AMP phosphodiesterase